MKKVLLVDDDALVRMFLRQIIPWEDEGYTVVGDARDGEEALEMIERFAPDLIVSDVSMPTLDGVELVRRLRADSYAGGIVMLSCHDDFAYVKNAMQLGADEYLLKNHLSPDSLRAALRTVAEKRGAPPAGSPALEALAQKGQRVLQQEVLERLLADSNVGSEPALLQEAGLRGRYATCTAVFLRIPREVNEQSVLELCFQIAAAGDLSDVEAVRAGQHSCAFLLDLTGQASRMYCEERARTLCARIELGMQTYLQLRSSIGVSQPCTGTHAVSAALRQANAALVAGFYGAGARWYGSPEAVLSDALPPAAERFAAELPRLLADDSGALETAYREALTAFQRSRVLPGVVLRWLQDCDMKAGMTRTLRDYAALDTIEDYTPLIAGFTDRARALAERQVPRGLSPQISAAVRFLQAHFAEPVTLGDAASVAGFHPSYFSTVFKQGLGTGFSEYLTDLRLARVRERLETTGDTIKDIAQGAGFFDYQHFCKTFKKKTGLSPAAYRRERQEIQK